MQPDILALIAAVGWAINGILVRKGSSRSPVAAAAFLSMFVTVACLWVIGWWYFPSGFLRTPATFYFVVGGLIQPAFVRLLNYVGIARLGVSRSQALRAVTPLFASVIALFALRERPSFAVFVAIILAVAGIALLSYRRERESDWKPLDLLFPLFAAVLAACSQNFRKAGLLILPDPLVGAALTTSTSLIVFVFTVWVSGNIRSICPSRTSLPFYGCGALISTAAQLLSFAALTRGDVSIVVTLTSTSPLFAVVFSRIFLKDQERIDVMVGIGVLTLFTAILIILNR